MFSSWDEQRFMGAVLCVITESVSYRPYRWVTTHKALQHCLS